MIIIKEYTKKIIDIIKKININENLLKQLIEISLNK